MAEKGRSVCLIERGKQYGMHQFPRRIHEIKKDFFWDPKDDQYGVMELRDYKGSDLMSVSASGLGGGSLIYANALMRMPAEFFDGWPCGVNRHVLDPFYDLVLDMMEASPYPFGRDPYYTDTPKTKHMQDIAQTLQQAPDATAKPEFLLPDLSINFEGAFPGAQAPNRHGAIQSKCTKCGECDIGCNIHAKNTLDLNYIFAAREKFGATIRTETLVTALIPLAGEGYEVVVHPSRDPMRTQSLKARKVILSAGSLGSNKLLQRMKRAGHLPNISPMLGKQWCGNGDLEGTVLSSDRELLVSNGPVITGAIQYQYGDYDDDFKHGAYIQDAGAPVGLIWYVAGKLPDPKSLWAQVKFGSKIVFGSLCRFLHIKRKGQVNFGDMVADMIDSDSFSRNSLVLLGMGRDRSSGSIALDEDGEPIISWQMEPSDLHYERLRSEMRKISDALNGTFVENPLTDRLNKIIAVHPLGGCVMADSPKEGVVDGKGEVFGYPGLHVIDASVIPTSIGPNPSLTIAALAEHMSSQIP
jgi:cholesterol oxidase